MPIRRVSMTANWLKSFAFVSAALIFVEVIPLGAAIVPFNVSALPRE